MAALAASFAAASLVAGCQIPPTPAVAPAADAGAAANLAEGDALVFHTEGGPVDEAGADAPELSLTEAIRRTLAADPRLQAALARVRTAEADARQTRLLPNPVLSIVFRFGQSAAPNIEASLVAEFVSLLQRPGLSAAADSRLRAAAADAVTTALEVLAEVQERYAAVQASEELLPVLGGRRQILDRLLDLAQARLDRGEGTRLDVLALRTQRVELDTEIADRELALREDRLGLTRLLGQPSGAADWKVEPWQPVARLGVPEARWVATATERRPEVQARRFEITALEAELRLLRFYPQSGSTAGLEAERDGGDWSAGPGVSLPLPVFDTGQARRQRAEAALAEARHNLTQMQRQVVEDTRRAHTALAATQANLERVRNELIPLAQSRREQAEAQFRAGQTDITGLLIAEEELRAARGRLIDLQLRTSEALIRLQRAVGGPAVAGQLEASTRPATGPANPPGTGRADRASLPGPESAGAGG